MKIRVIKAVIVALVLALGTVALWRAIDEASEQQIARAAEAESYAARSQLIRNVDTLLSALRNVRTFWYAFGHLPEDQWASDAGIELEHFSGIDMILWDDPERGVRYARTPDRPTFNYRPSDEEWASYEELLHTTRSADGSKIVGPTPTDDGEYRMTVIVTGRDPASGRLAAIVNVTRMLTHFLQDESPGFAVQIHTDGQLIFERGEASPTAPEDWIREGMIRSEFGSLWRVVHLPTTEMLRSYSSVSTDLTLLLGLVVSVLMGTLTFENSRARSRAKAAELAEAQVSELNRDLEEIVRARTSDLQTLTDSVAHDLRNPLNVLAVNIELLEDSYGSNLDRSERQEILARMNPCINQMTDILDRLLGMSTLANSTFDPEDVDMRELVQSIYEDMAHAEPESNVRFEVDSIPNAWADETLIQILLFNLISNALKYSRDCDEPIIRVGSESRDGEVVYFVRDNGIGFDAEQADRIFNAFIRLDENSKQEGIGLGLTLARKVIARHGGRIWAESKPGDGATFYFVLSPSSRDQA